MADEFTPTWEEVAHRYGRKIYNFAYRLTGNPDDAADLLQEVLIRVRKGLASYHPGSFEGWLWRITRNAFLDGVRKKQRRPEWALPEGDHHALGSSPSPDDVLASVRLSDDVQAALLKLPYDFREAVVLCDVVGLTYDEIAEATDVPVGTVRSRIHRGRKLLRGMLTWPV
jgi:RNA polymerase sigma-70 factor (ECF subfamily)